MDSLDPRISRLNIPDYIDPMPKREGLDQFETFEVFQMVKEGKPFEHVGMVHAHNSELAFLFAKEQYTRRGNTYMGLALAPTRAIRTTFITDGGKNVLQLWPEPIPEELTGPAQWYDVFYLKKRGKEPIHQGKVQAKSADEAIYISAKDNFQDPCLGVWAILNSDILFTNEEDKVIWNTLSEKKYREAIAYKSQDKINKFKGESSV
jgi:ring-1,2-phenylacetyl-CoA epoxidase subunit PaaB